MSSWWQNAKGGNAIGGHLVFVSHSDIDTWVARQIARRVDECGAVSFLDEAGIDVGADFENDILAFLTKADELVVLLTPWSLDRPYVWAEIGVAWGRRIPIVGLTLGLSPKELQERPGVPSIITRRNVISLNEAETYFDELRARVRAHTEAT